MTRQKNSAQTAETVQGTKETYQRQFTPNSGENTSTQNKIPYESRHGYCCLRNGKRGKSND